MANNRRGGGPGRWTKAGERVRRGVKLADQAHARAARRRRPGCCTYATFKQRWAKATNAVGYSIDVRGKARRVEHVALARVAWMGKLLSHPGVDPQQRSTLFHLAQRLMKA